MHWLRKTWPWVAFYAAMIAPGSGTALSAELAYPTKPIRLIVASSPGGPNDLLAHRPLIRLISSPAMMVLH
jgi:tripartite-type tricarboxylate transporter receptor subunit TctC